MAKLTQRVSCCVAQTALCLHNFFILVKEKGKRRRRRRRKTQRNVSIMSIRITIVSSCPFRSLFWSTSVPCPDPPMFLVPIHLICSQFWLFLFLLYSQFWYPAGDFVDITPTLTRNPWCGRTHLCHFLHDGYPNFISHTHTKQLVKCEAPLTLKAVQMGIGRAPRGECACWDLPGYDHVESE